MLEGSKSVHTCIVISSTTKRNRFGKLQDPTNYKYFSVIFCKWSVEVCPARGRYFIIIQKCWWTTTLFRTLFLIGLVMRVLEYLVKKRVTGYQRISKRSTSTRRRRMQLWNMPRMQYSLRTLLQRKNIQEVSSMCMFHSNKQHPTILYLLMLSMNVPTFLIYIKKVAVSINASRWLKWTMIR